MTHIKKIKIILLVVMALAFGAINHVSIASDQPQHATKIIGATKKNFNVRAKQLSEPASASVVEMEESQKSVTPEIMPAKGVVLPELEIEVEEEPQESIDIEPIIAQEPITKLKIEQADEESISIVDEVVAEDMKPQSLDLAEKIEVDLSAYIIGSGDTIKVTVFGEKDLSGEYKVADDGTIAMPLIGAINLKNKKLRDAENIIELAYKDGYLKDPSVSIEVQESRPFFILGEVRRPGSYNYIANMNILQAVAISGGFTYRANRRSVDILRGDTKKPQSISVNTKSLIQAGDIIFVRERFF